MIKRKIIKNKKKFIIVTIISVFLVAGIVSYLSYKRTIKNDTSNHYLMTVKGKVINIHSGQAVEGVEIRDGDKKVITDKNGFFSLDNVYNDSILTLNGKDFYEDLEIPLKSRQELIIQVDTKLFEFFRHIETYEKYRKYKAIYRLLSNYLKSQYQEADYLQRKNAKRDELKDKYGYVNFDLKISRDIKVLSEDRVEVELVYKLQKDDGSIDTFSKVIEIVFEDDNWYLNSLLFDILI